MSTTDQTALSGIIPEGDQGNLPLKQITTPPAEQERFFCPKMMDHSDSLEIIFQSVLGNNVDNVTSVCYNGCKNQCFN